MLLNFIYLCVAGWSFRDGTSFILTDEIGQIFIIGTGQGESQKDAKYDQVQKLFLPIKLSGRMPSASIGWLQSCNLSLSQ